MVSAASLSVTQFAANTGIAEVNIWANNANVTTCYIGGSTTVSALNGYGLQAGDEVKLRVSNTNVIWLYGSANAEVRYIVS